MKSRWRERARPIIHSVLEENRGKTDKEIRKALIEAYPFGERRYHPYKIWLDEIKKQRNSRRPLIIPNQLNLTYFKTMQGILFVEEMYKAIDEGRKTQTRRLFPDNNIVTEFPAFYRFNGINKKGEIIFDDKGSFFPIKPKFKAGQTLYLKEPYIVCEGIIYYKYDTPLCPGEKENIPWKNKMFMPAKYARKFIQIVNVRVERLKEITDIDAIAEGIAKYKDGYKNYITPDFVSTPANSFFSLWESINGKYSNPHNPWVQVFEFKKVDKPSDLI